MKTIAIGGPPASGKSMIVMSLLAKRLRRGYVEERLSYQKLKYIKSGTLAVLGEYEDGEMFAGTDRLAMDVMPSAINFLSQAPELGITTILFEGDRLFTERFLLECIRIGDLAIYLILTTRATTIARINSRQKQGKPFNMTFYKGRVTKINNIIRTFTGHVTLMNTTTSDLLSNVKVLESEIVRY